MIKEGSLVCLRDLRGKSWLVRVDKNRNFTFDRGQINMETLVGKDYGSKIEIKGRSPIFALRPGPPDFLKRFKKVTQVLYPDDCAVLVGTSGVGPGSEVVEAGTGSGGLTSYLAYHVQPTGHVYSYDKEQHHQDIALENIRIAGLEKHVTFHCRDIAQGIKEINMDSVFLDLACPWEGAIAAAQAALKPGGILTIFVPNWSQVERSVAAIKAGQFLLLEAFEIFRRDLKIDLSRSIMRPETRFVVAYTGVVISAAKLAPDLP
ncbi:MAG: tRNA (adenine-N1)-methyltransferase [Candidatus Heimdallarchaeota archaeon]